jgi:restriction alleviation protein Lar
MPGIGGMGNMTELKYTLNKCPFCNVFETMRLYDYLPKCKYLDGKHYVECGNCYAQGGRGHDQVSAINKWNMRDGKYE